MNPFSTRALVMAVAALCAGAANARSLTLIQQTDSAPLAPASTTLTLRLYDARDSQRPLATQTYFPGEWQPLKSNTIIRLNIPFDGLPEGIDDKVLWAEALADGQPLGDRVPLAPASGTGVTFASGNPLDMDGNKITQLGTPSAANDAATKQYVDDATAGNTAWQTGGNILTGSEVLGSSNDQPLTLQVNGSPVVRYRYAEDSFGNPAPNILAGSVNNEIAAGVHGASVSGGGGDPTVTTCGNGSQTCINRVTQAYGTVSGGWGNTASGHYASVCGGSGNTARGIYATVPGGHDNTAGGYHSFAAGSRAVVRDPASSGDSNGDEGSFVWSDGMFGNFISTGPNQFLIRATGGMGVGINAPDNQLHVTDAVSGGSIGTHVMQIENRNTGTSADGLAIKLGLSGNPAGGNNFISFYKGGDVLVGQIEGNGSGGVAYNTSGADFAEYLPAGDTNLQTAQVVALRQGRLWLDTRDAERLFVISGTAGFVGNGGSEASTQALAAFLGQVPVQVRGKVKAGDWLVASGQHDGKARAIRKDELFSVDLRRIVGRALQPARNGRTPALVGLPPQELLALQQERQQREIAALRAQLENQQELMAALQRQMQQLADGGVTREITVARR